MTTSTFDATDSAAVESGLPSRPEEKNWKYYSRHHEMPVSGASSLAVHLAAVGVLVVGGLLTAKVTPNGGPLDVVPALAPDMGAGQGSDARTGSGARNEEMANDVEPPRQPSSVLVPALGTIVPVKPKALIPDQENGQRTIADSSQKAVRGLAQQVEQALRQASKNDPRQPLDDGAVGGTGGAAGTITKTDERRQRWQLNFQVTGPRDHLRQFAALGAILAVPEPQGGFRIFKDLHAWPGLKARVVTDGDHPPSEHVDNLADIHRIGFSDRETVAEVANVLGTPRVPYLLAFFPKELEGKMARLERQFHHRPEDQIHSKTYFQVVPRGSGYDVVIDRSRVASD